MEKHLEIYVSIPQTGWVGFLYGRCFFRLLSFTTGVILFLTPSPDDNDVVKRRGGISKPVYIFLCGVGVVRCFFRLLSFTILFLGFPDPVPCRFADPVLCGIFPVFFFKNRPARVGCLAVFDDDARMLLGCTSGVMLPTGVFRVGFFFEPARVGCRFTTPANCFPLIARVANSFSFLSLAVFDDDARMLLVFPMFTSGVIIDDDDARLLFPMFTSGVMLPTGDTRLLFPMFTSGVMLPTGDTRLLFPMLLFTSGVMLPTMLAFTRHVANSFPFLSLAVFDDDATGCTSGVMLPTGVFRLFKVLFFSPHYFSPHYFSPHLTPPFPPYLFSRDFLVVPWVPRCLPILEFFVPLAFFLVYYIAVPCWSTVPCSFGGFCWLGAC
jgi:hypothetical protein